MGRRSDHTRTELFELSLAGTANIVQAEGLESLTIRKIAKDIGYSVGTIYNLYENLDDLVLHLNGQTCDDLYEHLLKTKISGNKSDIKELALAYLQFIQKNPNRWNALFEHKFPGNKPFPLWFLEKVNKPMHLLEEALIPLLKNQDEAFIKQQSRIFWSGLHGICSLSLGYKLDILTVQPVNLVIEQFVDVYLKGLGVK